MFSLYLIPKNTTKRLVRIRAPHNDKEFKMALSLSGAHVFCDGHSNLGLGPNFNSGYTQTIDDYTNLSGRGMILIPVRSNDPHDVQYFLGDPMKDPDHGCPDFHLRPTDYVGTTTNYLIPLPKVPKFLGKDIGETTTDDGLIHHYRRQNKHSNWLAVVKSTGDLPALR